MRWVGKTLQPRVQLDLVPLSPEDLETLKKIWEMDMRKVKDEDGQERV